MGRPPLSVASPPPSPVLVSGPLSLLHSILSIIMIIIIMIMIVNNDRIIVTTMVIIIIMTVNTNRHYCKCCKIWWMIRIMIWRVIRHVYRRIHILNNRCRLNNNNGIFGI